MKLKGNILPELQHRGRIKPARSTLSLRNVLFATDFSAASNNAWWYTLALARHYQSKLFVAHVISPTVYASLPPELLSEAQKRTRLEAQAQLSQLQQRQRGTTRLKSEALLREGDIANTLLRLVSEHNIDLLVVATRGHRHLKRLLLGSVAEKLFRQASCPVLVVPGQARMSSDQVLRVRRILCPTDFSPASFAALSFAILLAREHEAQLILAHVAVGSVLNSAEEMHRLRKSIKSRLQQLFPVRHGLALGPQFEVAFGAPAKVISRVAAEYQSDLVIIGVHSASPIQAHQYERTAYRVIRWSLCPVLTIPSSFKKGSRSSGRSHMEASYGAKNVRS